MAICEFCMDESPMRISKVIRGSGYNVLSYKDQNYLIRYNEDGEPYLFGRIVEKISYLGKRYYARLVPEFDLEPNERTAIKNLLSVAWK